MDARGTPTTLANVAWVADVRTYHELDSTNAEAMRLAARGAPSGTVVLAERQTAGRGRLGRGWWSEAGSSLTVSWIVRPDLPVERWSTLSLAAGLATADALEASTGLRVTLKWPNDVVHAGRKLAGILAEARPPGAVVVGLGVNLAGTPPVELRAVATTVEAAGGRPVDRIDVLAAILDRFGRHLERPNDIVDRYRIRCDTLGRVVRVERAGAPPILGVARDVDERGALVVEADDEIVALAAGDVVHLRVARPSEPG